jgi:hypothetical protein
LLYCRLHISIENHYIDSTGKKFIGLIMQEIDNMKYSDEELEILQDIEDDKYISVS